MNRIAVSALLGWCCFSWTVSASAVTVQFDDATRAPADSLLVDGVTVSSGATAGMPATVQGMGLGSDLVGLAGAVDCQLHYGAGNPFPDRQNGNSESLRLSVDGTINSITVAFDPPTLSGMGTPLDLSFAVGLSYPGLFGSTLYHVVSPGDPSMTLTLPAGDGNPSWVEFGNSYEPGEFVFFDSYRHNHLSEDQTIQFGFSIVSLDYTPVPEPGLPGIASLGLLLMGAVRLGSWRAKSGAR